MWPWTSNYSCVLFHYIDCCLVSRSYINIEVSSQVIIILNKSGSFSMRCKRSKHNSLRHFFCSSDRTFGTIFAQTFLLFSSSLRICRTLSLSYLTSSATVQTPNLWSFRITSRTFSVLSSVTAVCVCVCVDGLGDHHLSNFLCLPKIICTIHTCVHETCNLHRKPQSIIEKLPSQISSV